MTARERLAPLAARLRAALADEKQRVNLLVCMGLAGLLLLAVSSWLPADSSTQSAAPAAKTGSTADYAAELETRLTALISRVEGAGKTAVMVTLESGSEHLCYRHRQRRQLHPCTFGQRRGGRPCGDRRDAPRARRRRCLRGRRQCCRAEPRHRPGAGTDRHRH
ncbi:hypothetical protein NIA69_15230 [Gemmiger formicilis]|nr:hypothetical protein [Gemmiger formicilis]